MLVWNFWKTSYKSVFKLFEKYLGWLVKFIEWKKKHSNIWSKELVYEKTFWLSSHTPGYSLKSCPGLSLFGFFFAKLRAVKICFLNSEASFVLT